MTLLARFRRALPPPFRLLSGAMRPHPSPITDFGHRKLERNGRLTKFRDKCDGWPSRDVAGRGAMGGCHPGRSGRGRVGRGHQRSVCVLIPSPGAPARAGERLEILARTDDGFEIAEADLELRGPGEPWGARQSGLPGRTNGGRPTADRQRVVAR